MSNLFIIGNGFDLAHGLNTNYLDFKKYLNEMYPDAEFKCKRQFDYDCLSRFVDEFSAELLFYAMNKSTGLEWNNFENALGFFNFYEKFPRRSLKAKRSNDESDVNNYLLSVDIISNIMIQSTECWQDFFRWWIKQIEFEFENMNILPKTDLQNLFRRTDNLFLSFNYTKVLQKVYGVKKVIHVHNRVGQKLIFGHGDDKAKYSEIPENNTGLISSSFLDDLVLSFRKDTVSPMKKYSDFFRNLDEKIDKVYSFGFSYSKPDSVYIKTIINKIDANSIWHFTEYEVSCKEQIRIKKVKLRRYGFKGKFGVF